MSIALYDYQEKCLNDIRQAYREGARAPLLVSPTGSGKTHMFAAITRGAAQRGNRVLILVHRQELVDQVSDALREFGVDHGICAAGYGRLSFSQVTVASVFTLVRRLAQAREPNLIIVDEAHHAILRSTWGKVLSHFPRARILGTTATPVRLSGEGLGDIFDRLVVGPSVEWLIQHLRLSTVRVYAPPTIDTSGIGTRMGDFKKDQLLAACDRPKVVGDAIDHYNAITPGQRAAVFCVSLEHARHMQKAAMDAGISAAMIDGGMDRDNRRAIVKDFKDGKIKWLVSCELISEGFDCPGIDVGISLRPTQSLGLWLQQCGRILRVSSGKNHATILDHAGNSLRHGLPTEERDWSLAGRKQFAGKSEPTVSVRVCPKCWSAQRSGRSACANCGAPFPIESRTVAAEKGTLKEITAEDIARRRARRQVGQTQTLEALTELGRMRNYRNPQKWAQHVIEGRALKGVAR